MIYILNYPPKQRTECTTLLHLWFLSSVTLLLLQGHPPGYGRNPVTLLQLHRRFPGHVRNPVTTWMGTSKCNLVA